MLFMGDILVGSDEIPFEVIMYPANVSFWTGNIHFVGLIFKQFVCILLKMFSRFLLSSSSLLPQINMSSSIFLALLRPDIAISICF